MNFENYRQNELRIIEARKLFFDKGIVKREVIKDQTAFSWLRNKYKNIDPDSIATTYEDASMQVFGLLEKYIPLDMTSHWIGLYNNTGQLIRYYGCDSISKVMCGFDINEEVNGNNGIGAAYNGSDYSVVYGHEHYHTVLTNYITIGIPVDGELTLGIVLDISKTLSQDIEKCETLDVDVLSKLMMEKVYTKSNVPDLYFYRSSSPLLLSLCQQIEKLKNHAKVYYIVGPPGSGKRACAYYIHESMFIDHSGFVTCDVLHHTEESLRELIESMESGTLYIENLEWASTENQLRLLKKIDCKLINSKRHNQSNCNDLVIVVSRSVLSNRKASCYRLVDSLQSRLESFKLTIPQFTELGIDFKPLLQREIHLLLLKRGKLDLSIDDDLLSLLTAYDWPFQYRELIKVVDQLIYGKQRQEEWKKQSAFILMKESVLKSHGDFNLKYREKQTIIEALKFCNCNILQTSKALGITRTTLYKKIDEYEIEVKCLV